MMGSSAVDTGPGDSAMFGPEAPDRLLLSGGAVITMDDRLGDLASGDILIEGGVITAVGPDLRSRTSGLDVTTADMRGRIILPGLVDTHRHMWQTQFRMFRVDADLPLYSNSVHQGIAPFYEPSDMYAGNLLGAVGALDCGVTCVVDWSHNSRSPEHSDAAIDALFEAGGRAVHVSGAPRFNAPDHRHPHDIRRLREERFSSDDQLVSLAFGTFQVASTNEVRDVPGEREPRPDLSHALGIARSLGIRTSVEGCVGPESSANLVDAHRLGLLADDVTYVHCLDLQPEAWNAIRDSGGSVSISATSEAQMLGVFPATQDAVSHGVAPSVSLDTEICNGSDFFNQLRSILQLQRIAATSESDSEEDPQMLSSRDVLRFATVEGARAVGLLDRIGTITPGKQADLIAVAPRVTTALPLNSLVGTVVHNSTPDSVEMVLVAGRPRKWQGRLVGTDEARLSRLASESMESVLGRSGLRLSRDMPQEARGAAST